jgi:hypothetical protein
MGVNPLKDLSDDELVARAVQADAANQKFWLQMLNVLTQILAVLERLERRL